MKEISMQGDASASGIYTSNYRFLQEHVYAHTGIVLDEGKQYLFETRLSPIVQQLGLGSINELCFLLRDSRETEIGKQVAEAMTTNETYFFRDPNHFEAIRSALLPKLREQCRDTKTLRFWSAAASTGQEAYSLAMLLLEEGLGDWKIRIFGTDYSSAALERARSGKYQQLEVNRGLPVAMLVRYFRRSGTNWELNDCVRRMVEFETLDLRGSMHTLGPFDLVFCRNVLIYFDPKTKKNIVEKLHATLCPGGWLLLGGAETIFGVEDWFERQTPGSTTVYVAR